MPRSRTSATSVCPVDVTPVCSVRRVKLEADDASGLSSMRSATPRTATRMSSAEITPSTRVVPNTGSLNMTTMLLSVNAACPTLSSGRGSPSSTISYTSLTLAGVGPTQSRRLGMVYVSCVGEWER